MDLLSALTLAPDAVTKATHALVASEFIDEAVVLSTCNRTEIYASVSRFHNALTELGQALAGAAGVSLDTVTASCSVFYDEAAVQHCFTMASGLDSMVVGEHQVLGQTRQALRSAQHAGTVGTTLNALFQQALRVAKRVQTETAIGTAGRSLVTASLTELQRRGVAIDRARAVVLGAGSMASLAAHTLSEHGASVTCVNRTFDRAQHLARAIGGSALPLDRLDEAMASADILITCTGARGFTVSAADIAQTTLRGVIDLALPADVDADVAEQLTLVNLAGLAELTGGETEEVTTATELVRGEVADFLALRRAAQVTPTVVALRTMATDVVAAELARLETRLPEMDADERAEIQRTVRRVVDKLLHQPTVRVKELAAVPDSPDYAAALRELFALDTATVDAVSAAE